MLFATFTPADTANYESVSSSDEVTVNKAVPQLTWYSPASIPYGTKLSGAQLNATAASNGTSLPGTFVYSPALGTLPTGGSHTLYVTFTPAGSAANVISTATSVDTAIVDNANEASPARATSMVREATPLRSSVK